MLVKQEGFLVTVKHIGKGNADNGRMACEAIEKAVNALQGHAIVYHDAAMLQSADDQYVAAFMALEKRVRGKVRMTVCFIPNVWLRTLAKAVGAVAPGKWHFFGKADEARAFLASKGGSAHGAGPAAPQ
jgi:hypothetical protein